MKIDYNKKEFTLEEKTQMKIETATIKTEYPNHIAILIRIDSNVLKIEKCKYLVIGDITVGDYLNTLKKKLINIVPSDKLMISVSKLDGTNIPIDSFSKTLKDFYNLHKDPESDLLIFSVSRQTTFKYIKNLASYYMGY
jgi:hypothetical protein